MVELPARHFFDVQESSLQRVAIPASNAPSEGKAPTEARGESAVKTEGETDRKAVKSMEENAKATAQNAKATSSLMA